MSSEPSETREMQFRNFNWTDPTPKHNVFVPLLLGPRLYVLLSNRRLDYGVFYLSRKPGALQTIPEASGLELPEPRTTI